MGLGIWVTEFETVPSPRRQHSKKSRYANCIGLEVGGQLKKPGRRCHQATIDEYAIRFAQSPERIPGRHRLVGLTSAGKISFWPFFLASSF
jgi:hypothetical protein